MARPRVLGNLGDLLELVGDTHGHRPGLLGGQGSQSPVVEPAALAQTVAAPVEGGERHEHRVVVGQGDHLASDRLEDPEGARANGRPSLQATNSKSSPTTRGSVNMSRRSPSSSASRGISPLTAR